MNKLKSSFILCMGFLLIPVSKMSSQNVLTQETIGFQEGEFTRTLVDYFATGDSGPNCLWDFTDLEISKKTQVVTQTIDSLGQLVIADNRQITYYMMQGDSLLEIGHETPLKDISYCKTPCSMKYPMAFGDSISKAYEGYGAYCGDHYYKETGVCNIVVDGMGDILLSDTDTLKNAIRVYKLKSYSVAMDMEPSKIDSARLKQVIEERYEWYIKGYNRPILETVTSTSYSDLSPLGTTQYAYCNLPDLSTLVSENQQSDNNNDDGNNNANDNNEDGQNTQQGIMHYSVNVYGNQVNIDYSLDADANITMLIANNMGMLFMSKHFSQGAGEGYHADFDIGGLRPGVYVLYINVNGKIYHEKIKK